VKEAWDALPESEKVKFGHYKDMLRISERMVSDMDAKIQRQERRVVAEPEVGVNLDSAGKTAQQEQLEAIESRITELVAQMDQLAEAGEVDEVCSLGEIIFLFRSNYQNQN
jgi:hypothetical protein